jgi:hypothetical protein
MVQQTMANADILHEAEGQHGVAQDPNISDEEQAEVKRIMNLFHIFKRYRQRYDKRWLDYYRLTRGCQWDTRRPRWKNSEVVNLVWQTIQSQIPLQTDVRPRFSFLPQNPADREFAEILDQVADSDFEKYNWLRTVFEVLLDGWIYGTGYSSMGYSQEIDYGLGAALYKSEDIFHCYPHPDANTINDDESDVFFYAKPVATDKVKRDYPDKAKFIKSDITDKAKKERTELKGFQTTYFNSDRDLAEGSYGDANNVLDDLPRTMVFTMYSKPKEVEEQKLEADEAGEEKFIVKRKYPKGRKVVIANNMILADEELPHEDMEIPFSKFNNYILPREFYGVSEVEQLESPQIVFNKILSFSLDALAMTGNPIWVVDTNAEVDTDNLNNIPGSVVEKNPGTEVRREAGVGITPSAFQMLDRLVEWFNTVAGQSEFSQGDAPGGVTAASAIEQLIRAGRTRIRQKQRNLDEYMKDAGRQYMNRVFQYYTVPKIFRITEKDGSQAYRKFRVEKDEQGNRVAIFSDFDEDETGRLNELPERQLIIQGNFDVRVTTGSELPFDVADNERKALALFDRGIIDEEEVLNRIEYPNKEKVLERLKQRAEAMAQAEQQQAQGGQ